MLRNDPAWLRVRQIDVLERLRELLFELEQGELPARLHEQIHDARLRTDREIEALR
jgi:hypothetical protein